MRYMLPIVALALGLSACSQKDENAAATADAEEAGMQEGMNYPTAADENATTADQPVETEVQDNVLPGADSTSEATSAAEAQ